MAFKALFAPLLMEMHAAPECRSSWTLAARKAKIAPQKKDLKDRAGRVRFNVEERKLKTMS